MCQTTVYLVKSQESSASNYNQCTAVWQGKVHSYVFFKLNIKQRNSRNITVCSTEFWTWLVSLISHCVKWKFFLLLRHFFGQSCNFQQLLHCTRVCPKVLAEIPLHDQKDNSMYREGVFTYCRLNLLFLVVYSSLFF